MRIITYKDSRFIVNEDIPFDQSSVPLRMISPTGTIVHGKVEYILDEYNLSDIHSLNNYLNRNQFDFSVSDVFSNGINPEARIDIREAETWTKLAIQTPIDNIINVYKSFEAFCKLVSPTAVISTKGVNKTIIIYSDDVCIPLSCVNEYVSMFPYSKFPVSHDIDLFGLSGNKHTVFKIPSVMNKYVPAIIKKEHYNHIIDLVGSDAVKTKLLPDNYEPMSKVDNVIILKTTT